jgi:hypothetical protein
MNLSTVIPAKAGTHLSACSHWENCFCASHIDESWGIAHPWIPAYAGMAMGGK